MPAFFKISVNIPVRSPSVTKPVLNSLRKINYPPELVEIIIVKGNQIAKQRNLAIKESTGDIVYLLDDDSEINPDSFRIISGEFNKKNVAAVGGPSLAKKDKNYLNFLIGCALETYFGAMRMRFRYSQQQPTTDSNEYHLIGANLALKKKAIKKIGLFNEKITPNEETELLRRLKKSGFRLVYKKELFIYRNHRKTLRDLARQFHYYGIGRMKQILHSGSLEDLIFILPTTFLFYSISVIFFHSEWYLIPLFLYLMLAFATSWKASFKYSKPLLIFMLPVIFFIIHISYAIGIVNEFVNSLIKSAKKENERKMSVKKLSLTDLRNNPYLSG